MVTAKERYYYTWRATKDPNIWDCQKWDSLGDSGIPEATYKVEPFFGGWRGACSCQAYVTCKHIRELQKVLIEKRQNELPGLKWDMKNGWKEIDL